MRQAVRGEGAENGKEKQQVGVVQRGEDWKVKQE
jgi:hypothetical protein